MCMLMIGYARANVDTRGDYERELEKAIEERRKVAQKELRKMERRLAEIRKEYRQVAG